MLEIKNISKTFPGVQALQNVSFEINDSEVHGLVGENGAGKSTLMHILAGVFPPDEGIIRLNGQELVFQDERHAQQCGIGMVFQERSLINGISIAENIFAGRQPISKLNFVDFRKMNELAAGFLNQVGLKLDPNRKVDGLTSIEKQLVEIAKALSLDAKVLILDEPTATITERETDTLFALVNELKVKCISIIYISHRLQELHAICDRVSVLKDGVYMGTREMSKVSMNEIVTMMVGREIHNKYEDLKIKREDVVLEVKNLSSKAFKDVNFKLYKQEILGLAGLAGAGRTEIALALFGADPHAKGDIILNGKKRKINKPQQAIRAGIGYLTEDRKESGLFLDLSVSWNIISANLNKVTKNGFVQDNKLRRQAKEFVKQLSIATPSLNQKAINLSGGNQQKLLMARWLMRDTGILIIDEPTRGVDVGAKAEIYNLIRDIAKQGTSVIVISSELPEILTLCDRTIIMWQGNLTGELLQSESSEEKIMHFASGLNIQGVI